MNTVNILQWETIESTKGNKNVTLRAKVFGGWLVKHRILTKFVDDNEKGGGKLQTNAIGLCFVPDPKYKWETK